MGWGLRDVLRTGEMSRRFDIDIVMNRKGVSCRWSRGIIDSGGINRVMAGSRMRNQRSVMNSFNVLI